MYYNTIMKKKSKKLLWIVLGIVAAVVVVFLVYLNTYSVALPQAQALAAAMENRDGDLYLTTQSNKGFIIYPGGKVDERAYAPLATLLHNEGYNVVIAKMPFHLAIFDSKKAADIIEQNPQIGNWVIVGHSLGGTAASMYADAEPGQLSGIVFLGSYPYKDISQQQMFALDIRGSNDEVLDWEKADAAVPLYPANTQHSIIEGGNHAGFGEYGAQRGDGTATITPQEQTAETVRLIMELAQPA